MLQMPLLDHNKLVTSKQQRLAHMCLTFIGSAYVWQDGDIGVVRVNVQQCCIVMMVMMTEMDFIRRLKQLRCITQLQN